jgi:hypothetical protein
MCGARPSATPPSARIDIGAPYWVAVRCEFTCRLCRHQAPLNHFDADGSVQCVGCGTEQRFELAQWRDLVQHAHAVGDLAGQPPEATGLLADQNPYECIGVTNQCMELDRQAGSEDELDLKIKAAPGHPLSQEDQLLLQLEARDGSELSLRHPRNGAVSTYETPRRARDLGVRGVIAAQHRKGGAVARSSGGAAGLALTCPTCSAPLESSALGTVVTCTFCSASVIVPVAALRAIGHTTIPSAVWWMLFEGPSKRRKQLLVARKADERKAEGARRWAETKADKERQRALSRAAGSRPSGSPRKKPLSPGVIALLVIAALAVLGLLAWGAVAQPLKGTSAPSAPAAR